jgi:hypothetical protein
LELGRFLVKGLSTEGRRDPACRWLAHYLAELVDRAEQAKTDDEKRIASQEAFKILMELWKQRSALPGEANPLAMARDVSPVLNALRPGRTYWHRHADGGKAAVCRELFDNTNRLMLWLLFGEVMGLEEMPHEIQRKLGSAERGLLTEMERLIALLPQSSGEEGVGPDAPLVATVIPAIDDVAKSLDKLRQYVNTTKNSQQERDEQTE